MIISLVCADRCLKNTLQLKFRNSFSLARALAETNIAVLLANSPLLKLGDIF